MRNDIEVVGVLHGYSHLVEYSPENPLVEGRDYVMVSHRMLGRTRNSQGILLGTARTNPGKNVSHPTHLDDPERVKPLKTVYEALRSINVDALISIGGDDTLKTANKFKLYQEKLPPGALRIPVVHLPKTIDNDYRGIDFTFGYFTAVDFLGNEVRNLIADAEANRAYFLVEAMGRSAGWLAYGVAIAGEASLVISVEDIEGPYAATEEVKHPKTGQVSQRKIMNVDKVVKRIVLTMLTREQRRQRIWRDRDRRRPGRTACRRSTWKASAAMNTGTSTSPPCNLYDVLKDLISKEYKAQTGKIAKDHRLATGLRIALRQAARVRRHARLPAGRRRVSALVEKGLNGVMVSVSGQLQLRYVPFEELVDPSTLVTVVRHIEPDSDFHKLTRFLEVYVNEEELTRRQIAARASASRPT